MLFCLCRTDPDGAQAPRHLLRARPDERRRESNGIELDRSGRSGDADFTATFLDEAGALTNVIGGLNNGWRVTMTTLGSERAAARRPARPVRAAVLARSRPRRGLADDPRSASSWRGPSPTSRSCATGAWPLRDSDRAGAGAARVDQQDVLVGVLAATSTCW